MRVINYAATQPNVPFMSIKVTGLVRFSLLEELDKAMHAAKGSLIKRYEVALQQVPAGSRGEWNRLLERLEAICALAEAKGVGVLIDAEESWIQDPVDAAITIMMDRHNKHKALIYNTAQLYRHDRLQFIKDCHAAAKERGFIFGIKIVRGAYMEKERKRAAEMGYLSPIQPDKKATDRDFDEAMEYCLRNLDHVAVVIATHNEKSNLQGAQLMDALMIPHHHKHVHFSQLFGMSDNITFNLAKEGLSVSKYLPFGPIADVMPYLMRRAQENTSVEGQTGRELALIEKELKRRKL